MYKEYLEQLKYFIMCVVEPDVRQDFLFVLMSEQAMKN